MRVLKKAATLLLAAAMLLSAASCSGDQTWSVKTSEETLPIGVYIYNTYAAYQEAYSQTLDTSSSSTSSSLDVLSKTIEETPATEWIENRALELCRLNLAVNQKFNEMGLSFTDEETESIQNDINTAWNQNKSFLESLGVAKESFASAYGWYSAKNSKLFEAIYGRDGTNALSDDEVEAYFTENYTHFGWFSKALTKTEDGQNTNMTDEEIEEVQKQFEEYAEQINNGGQSIEDVSSNYTTAEGLEKNPFSEYTEQVGNTSLNEELKNAINDLENGKAVAVKSGNYYYLIYKYNIQDSVSRLSEDNAYMNVVADMKGEEFTETIQSEAEALVIETNDGALQKYNPSRIENELNK